MGCCASSREYESADSKAATIVQGDLLSTDESMHQERSDVRISLRSEESVLWVPALLEKHYQVLQENSLGEGKIVHALHVKTKLLRSIKVVPKTKRRSSEKVTANLLSSLMSLDHPHILKTLEVCEDSSNIYIVREHYQGGTLAEYLQMHSHLSENCAAEILREVLSALSYAQSRGVNHFHISCHSVVFLSVGGSTALTDFDSSILQERSVSLEPPEMKKMSVSEKTDIWLCGMLLSAMVLGHDFHQQECSLDEDAVKPSISASVLQLISWMLSGQPRNRPTIAECLEHPFLKREPQLPPPSNEKTIAILQKERERPRTLKEAIKRFIVIMVLKGRDTIDAVTCFDSLDQNLDGVVSAEEILQKLTLLMPEDEAVKQRDLIVRKLDRNINHVIDFSEFVMSAISDDALYGSGRLREVFNIFDRDGNDRISLSELQSYFCINVTIDSDKVWGRLLSEVDTSGDGEIDFAEFENLMRYSP